MMKRFRCHLEDKWAQLNDLQLTLDFWLKLYPDFKLPPQDPSYDCGRLWKHWEYIIDAQKMEYKHRVENEKSEKHLLIPNEQCEEWIANYENIKEAWEVHQKELKIESENGSDSKKVKTKR